MVAGKMNAGQGEGDQADALVLDAEHKVRLKIEERN